MKDYNVYRVNSKAWKGFLFLRYQDGGLMDIVLNENIGQEAFAALVKVLPYRETDIDRRVQLPVQRPVLCTFEKVPGKTAAEKIKLFAGAFKAYRNTVYRPTQNESSNIKRVPVNKKLLDVFFTSPLQHFTIDNYIKRINITQDHAENGRPVPNAFEYPNYHDPDFERGLPADKLMAYHRHLIGLGYEKKTLPGQPTRWVEKRRD